MVKLRINGFLVLDEDIIDFEGKETIDLIKASQKAFGPKMKYSFINLHYHNLDRELLGKYNV